jgi:Uma2 family endonuclease
MPLSRCKCGWCERLVSISSIRMLQSTLLLKTVRTNEPEPDLVVLAKPSREFRDANPRPTDLRLVVEISDSTLGFDLTTKAELYARAGIVEYWVVDVAARRLIVHRGPREGLYGSVTAYSEEECVTPLASSGREFRVAGAFDA